MAGGGCCTAVWSPSPAGQCFAGTTKWPPLEPRKLRRMCDDECTLSNRSKKKNKLESDGRSTNCHLVCEAGSCLSATEFSRLQIKWEVFIATCVLVCITGEFSATVDVFSATPSIGRLQQSGGLLPGTGRFSSQTIATSASEQTTDWATVESV